MACSHRRWKWLSPAILVACFGLLLAISTPVHAANPTTISFQGKVVNANGTNVTDGSYGFVFKLYTVSSGGSAVWTETDTLTVTAGTFQVNLGAVCPFFTANACNGSTPIDFNANPNLYLGITFNSDPAGEMSPRVQLQSVPYAYNADKVGGLTASQLVQLSPGSQQTGFINLSGGATLGGLATLSGGASLTGTFGQTYSSGVTGNAAAITANNTNSGGTAATVNGVDVTLTGHTNTSSNTLNGINLENVTAVAGNTFNALNVGTGYNNGINFSSASGITDFINTPTAVLTSGGALTGLTGVTLTSGNLTLTSGSISGVTTISTSGAINGLGISSGALTGVTGITTSGAYTQSGASVNAFTGATSVTNNLTVNTGTANELLVSSGANVPTADLAVITNAGSTGTVTAGANDLHIKFKGGAAAVEAAGEEIDMQPGTTSGGTWDGLEVVPNATGAVTGVVENGLKVATLTTPGTGTENALYVGQGWDNILSYNGNSLINGTGIIQNFAFSTSTSYTNLTEVGALTSGSIASGFGTISTANTITGTQINGTTGIYSGTGAGTQRIDNVGNLLNIATITATGSILDSDTADMVLDLTGAPDTTATDSLVQLGGTGFSGNTTTDGGTYVGINAPASGAGSVADFANFQNNGVSKFKIDSLGDVTNAGGYTGGEYNPGQFTDAAVGTHTVTNDDLVYDLSSTSGTTAANFLTTFNITGLPATDGTLAYITFTCAKGTATGNHTHTCITEISGTAVTQTLSASSTGTAVTVTHSFVIARIAGVWDIVGTGGVQGAVGVAVSSSTTADYAEWIDFSGDAEPQPGDVLTVGSDPTSVTDTSTPYDPATLGVVSTSPYDVGGADDGHSVVIALSGRVPVNVNLANGPIKAGDPLTASSIPGQAMKATAPGRIIGIALSGYDGSQSDAQVTVQLGVGYDDPTNSSSGTSSQSNQSVINAQLTGDGALSITSGTDGDVTMDTAADGTINIGTGNAGAVSISRSGQTTTVNGALTVDQSATFNAGVSMNFTDNHNLNITSDLSGDTSAVSVVGTPSSTPGDKNGVLIQQANSANTNGLSGGLTIDNANTSLPINSAIRITNSGGGGYADLISSPNFTVTGSGNVVANNLQVNIGSGGVFKLVNTAGTSVVSIDDSGNATFDGSLNLTGANLSGALSVGGDVNVAGLSTFQKLATFLAKTVFKQDVEFDGHITVASDTAGYASLRVGETTVHITFTTPYANPPVVNASVINGQFVLSSVNNVTAKGFDITTQAPVTAATTFSWTAIAVNNPQTATNPLPPVNTKAATPSTTAPATASSTSPQAL
jgi:hypothetical protein